MCREQIKEALDKIIYLTECEPVKLTVTSMIPDDVRVTYTDDEEFQVEYMYSNGELFLLDEGSQSLMK
ncbi:hypothetical protein P7F88_06170 [Vibrio hannami]|uniref:hypothetical protein n=1 Tax=Vibrio hannami TaxID=2717094 RepID=UPI00240F4993|nr:hypothetical protein [Vibrio hannami]MDG3085708.1 hypothetical protein [Vibrio hannami]